MIVSRGGVSPPECGFFPPEYGGRSSRMRGLFAWIRGAVHTYFMEYFIQCISKIWKSAYFFRQYSTQLDIVRCSSTIFNSCDFERKDFIYSIPIYWENLILIF